MAVYIIYSTNSKSGTENKTIIREFNLSCVIRGVGGLETKVVQTKASTKRYLKIKNVKFL